MRWHHVRTLLAEQAERLTQAVLAEELGVPKSTLGRWVRGKQEPQGLVRQKLFQWAEALPSAPTAEVPRERAVLEGQSIEIEALLAYALERQRRLTAHLRDEPAAPQLAVR